MEQDALQLGPDPGGDQQFRENPAVRDHNGIVGAIISGAIDASRERKTASQVPSAREALGHFDADPMLLNGIRAGLAGANWIILSNPTVLHDTEPMARSTLLDAAAGRYLADATCGYRLARKFNAIYAWCWLEIADRTGATGVQGEARWRTPNLVYQKLVQSEVALANPSPSYEQRRAQWFQNSAEPLRHALGTAFEHLGPLIGRQLTLSNTDIADAQRRPFVKIITVYTGDLAWHRGNIMEGEANLVDFVSPTFNAKVARYRSGTNGMLLLQQGNRYYHHFSFEVP
jgi:hypothetical protein